MIRSYILNHSHGSYKKCRFSVQAVTNNKKERHYKVSRYKKHVLSVIVIIIYRLIHKANSFRPVSTIIMEAKI